MAVRIIGIGGTNGSGKDTVGAILQSEHGYRFISATDLLREECRRRELSIDRHNLRMISSEWRHAYGLGAVVDKAIEAYRDGVGEYIPIAIASLRNPGEGARIHELGGQVWWIDANPELRYRRVIGTDRGRASEDNKTYEQFLEEEAIEMYPAADADETALNTAAVRDMADATITNEGSVEDLKRQVADQLNR